MHKILDSKISTDITFRHYICY